MVIITPEIDYDIYRSTVHHVKAKQFLLDYIESIFHVDPFRVLHSSIKKFTWRRLNPQRKLYVFLISNAFLDKVRECNIDISLKSDHSIVLLILFHY